MHRYSTSPTVTQNRLNCQIICIFKTCMYMSEHLVHRKSHGDSNQTNVIKVSRRETVSSQSKIKCPVEIAEIYLVNEFD